MLFSTKHLSGSNFIDGDKFQTISESRPSSTVYLTTHEASRRVEFKEILAPIGTVLVTHNSDHPVTSSMVDYAASAHIRHWYAQNLEVPCELATPLPIGLERTRWFPEKRSMLLDGISRQETTPTRLCLSNFSLETNYTQRVACRNAGLGFSSMYVRPRVSQTAYQWFVGEILDHWFVLCPEGNGVDTHRLWETLYLGRIPVVTSSGVTEFMKDLPLLILPSWEELTESVLREYLDRFLRGGIVYSLDKLDVRYWEALITLKNS